jgi:hypothetical protein
MRTFARLFGTGFAVLLLVLAATAQAGGGKAVTPPSAGLVAGLSPALSYILSPALSYILKRFYDCIVELGADHTLPGTYPNDPHPNDCTPEWRPSFEGLVWEGKTPADAKLLLIQIALEAGGYAMRNHVAKYGDGPAPPPTAARPSR